MKNGTLEKNLARSKRLRLAGDLLKLKQKMIEMFKWQLYLYCS